MIRNRKILFWRLRDIWLDHNVFLEDKKSDIVILHSSKVLNKNKFNIIILKKTFTIDLSQSKNNLLKNFHKTLRWSINKAKREHVDVKKIETKKNIDYFYKFFCNFCEKKKIPKPAVKEFYEYDVFVAKDKITNKYLGGCCFLKDNKKNIYRYKHGAVIYRGQENEAIIWNAIKRAKKEGYKSFDMGGVKPTDDKKSYDYRHYSFKKRFGGELSDFYTYIKVNNFLLKPLIYLSKPIIYIFLRNQSNTIINLLNNLKILK